MLSIGSTEIILILSISTQFISVILSALSAMWFSQNRKIHFMWMMPIIFLYMTIRRSINLIVFFASEQVLTQNLGTLPSIEIIALVISILWAVFTYIFYKGVRDGRFGCSCGDK